MIENGATQRLVWEEGEVENCRGKGWAIVEKKRTRKSGYGKAARNHRRGTSSAFSGLGEWGDLGINEGQEEMGLN